MISPEKIAHYAHMAAVMEASAEKPGNVTPTKGFKDLSYQDFLEAAKNLEPFVERAAREGENAELGKLIYEATSGKRNVNFGIIILFLPLAASHGKGTKKIISSLNPIDCKWIVKAMQKGKLGSMELKDKKISRYDVLSDGIFSVIDEGGITPLRLMEMSQPYDTLAREWVNDYKISREIGNRIESEPHSIVNEYLHVLSRFPDTLIARKAGVKKAEEVSLLAKRVLAGSLDINEFDTYLRSEGNKLNPGTTADLIASGLFLKLLS